MGFIQTRNTETCKKETTFGITFIKNGKQIVKAPEGFTYSEGVVGVEVPEEANLVQLGFTEEQEAEYNKPMTDGIDYAKKMQKEWENIESEQEKYYGDNNIVFLPTLDMSNVRNLRSTFAACKKLQIVAPQNTQGVTDFTQSFSNDFELVELDLYCDSATTLYRICLSCVELKKIKLRNCQNVKDWDNIIGYGRAVIIAEIDGWQFGNLAIEESSNLTIDSVKFIIDNAEINLTKPFRKFTLINAVGVKFAADPDFPLYQQRMQEKGIDLEY